MSETGKAFIFDMDGVLINNEPYWEEHKTKLFSDLYGKEIASKMGSTVGLNMEAIHQRAVSLGADKSDQPLRDSFHNHAITIYSAVPITEGMEELGETLINEDYALGIVSASPRAWMDLVINRLTFKEYLKVILSLEERDDLPHKPAPDGYLEAMRILKAVPESTVILEDSNAGIKSAKAAGAFVIGLKQNLVKGYVQEGADRYVNRVIDVIPFLKKFG